MQKTKLGIPFGLLAAAIYFTGLFGGYIPVILLTAYVLLVEDDEWLRRSSVKAIMLMVLFSLIHIVLGFIPDVLDVLTDIIALFTEAFTYGKFLQIIGILNNIFNILEYILFIALGVTALKGRSILLPVVDKMIYKHMG